MRPERRAMAAADDAPAVSIVIPVYNEAAGLDTLHARLLPVLDGLDRRSELIFVDDGSVDGARAVRPGARRLGGAGPGRHPGQPRRAAHRTVAVLAPPLPPPRLRRHDGLLDGADPARVAGRDRGRARRHGIRRLPVRPPPDR